MNAQIDWTGTLITAGVTALVDYFLDKKLGRAVLVGATAGTCYAVLTTQTLTPLKSINLDTGGVT
jgi:hypothetical protein